MGKYVYMTAKCDSCLKVIAAEVFEKGSDTESFLNEYERNGYVVESVDTPPMIEGCQCKQELSRLCAESLENAAKIEQYRDVLASLLLWAERNTCTHEETYRGGAIWTICRYCEEKWADDEGGKPDWKDPEEWEKARNLLAEIPTISLITENELLVSFLQSIAEMAEKSKSNDLIAKFTHSALQAYRKGRSVL